MQNEIEVMRVLRVPPMGALVVQIGDRRLTTISQVTDDKSRRRLLAAIGELIDFAGGYQTLAEAGVAPPLPQVESVSPHLDIEEELTAEQAAFLDELQREMRGGAPLEPSAGSQTGSVPLDEVPLTSPAPELQGSAGAGMSFVAEIDGILQKHVSRNPALAQRSIHLRQSPGESLQIVVDKRVYSHPNEIEDNEVKQVLKRALKEWEAR